MDNVVFIITPVKQADFTIIPTSLSVTVGQSAPLTVAVSSMGTSGLQGVQGIQGIQGVQGVTGGSYTHVQGSAATVWNIPHNLGFYPSVSVRDSSNRNVFTDINHIDQNNSQVIITNAFSGTAYLS